MVHMKLQKIPAQGIGGPLGHDSVGQRAVDGRHEIFPSLTRCEILSNPIFRCACGRPGGATPYQANQS